MFKKDVIYIKEIEKSHLNFITASVFCVKENDNIAPKIALKFFNISIFTSTKKAYEKAHKWADNEIVLAKKYESRLKLK